MELSTNRRFEQIAIDQIDLGHLSNRTHDPTLTRSIEARGQEVPIIVGYNTNEPTTPFRIIEGARRTLSMIHLENRFILAEVREDLAPTTLDQLVTDAQSTLATNANRSRNYGAEMMAVRDILSAHNDDSSVEALNHIADSTGMHMREVKLLSNLSSSLTPSATLALVQGRMTGAVAKRFAKLSRPDQDRLAAESKITGRDVESALRAQRNVQLDALNGIDIPSLGPPAPPIRLADELDQYAQRLCGEDRCALIAAAEVIRRYEEESNATA
jgi:hypothetical protein|tara:strand:- start:3085 stop:3897 length:813 start_codon:yes stop_codon:yes gene_type:complete